MVIILKNKRDQPFFTRSAQFRYALIYVTITFIVLLFLNLYCSNFSEKLFYDNKEKAMIEICHLTAGNIAQLDVWNESTIGEAVADVNNLQNTRVIVTNTICRVIYDSVENENIINKFALFPEVVKSLEGNDVFTGRNTGTTMQSRAASPIYAYGNLVGCVYILEYNQEQGQLIASIQQNIMFITILLEIVIIIFSLLFASRYSLRLKKIMKSIRTVRDGDYSHTVTITGSDELNTLSMEFNALIQRLQISEKKRNQFVSDASHELKTPLASIKLLSDSILQNPMDEDTIKEFVSDIGNEADRLNRMSQKLLSLSRTEDQYAETGKITYLQPTIEKVIRMLSVTACKKNVQIQAHYTQDTPILISDDDLYQIMFNLIENGIKYNKQHGSLNIELTRSHNNAIITISDTGVGIPEDSISHVFERFYRVDKARSRSTGGSGLGLSIVRNLVKRNSGTIKIDSTLGVGTTFTVTFPTTDIKEDSV